MKMNVLMLGWEFPPIINGGLGIACHALSETLSKHVNLHVVLPKADISAEYDKYRVTSLSHLALGTQEESSQKHVVDEHSQGTTITHTYVDSPNISPYYHDESVPTQHVNTEHGRQVFTKPQSTDQRVEKEIPRFQIDQLYGEDIGQKVFEFSQSLVHAAKQFEFDLIHAHDWMTYQAGVELKRQTGKPLILHLHASQYDRAGAEARGWVYEIERNGMMAADLVIPVSNYTAEIVRSHYGIPHGKVRTVHNGAEKVSSYRTTKKFPEKMVLFLGRLTTQKGPEFFLEIASLVLAKNPDVRFVMAGTGEKMRSLIETGAFKGLGSRFHFTGFLDKEKVRTLLSMTDVYCMPSVSEPFGLSALEAAQFGIPAVISKQSGVAEILKGALTADYWDTQLMAQHISSLISDKKLRKRVIEGAHKDIEAATWEAAASKIKSLYDELLDE